MINTITKHFARSNFSTVDATHIVTSAETKIKKDVINNILTTFFKKFYILISTPVYTITPNGIKISILYFQPTTAKKRRGGKVRTNRLALLNKAYYKQLTTKMSTSAQGREEEIQTSTPVSTRSRVTFLVLLLSRLLKNNVQLELVRIKYVYHDSNILAQFLGINSHKNTYGKIKSLLWRRVTTTPNTTNNQIDNSQTQLTGFRIKISGRLAKQRVVPKQTVKSTYKGAISPNKNNIVQEATFTGKNKKGAYSIRVWTSHGAPLGKG